MMKTYVLMLSKAFPAHHSKAGKPTNFVANFFQGAKIHTIRNNYPLWAKRIKEIQQGEAVLSVRQWEGKPYRSKQVEIMRLASVEIQKLTFKVGYSNIPNINLPVVDEYYVDVEDLALNDGLSLEDWKEWFKGTDITKPLAIIHLTEFRYGE